MKIFINDQTVNWDEKCFMLPEGSHKKVGKIK